MMISIDFPRNAIGMTGAGTSYAQILCSLEHWQLTSCQLGPLVALHCAVAWLKTRQGFGKAVALFDHLELWRWEVPWKILESLEMGIPKLKWK